MDAQQYLLMRLRRELSVAEKDGEHEIVAEVRRTMWSIQKHSPREDPAMAFVRPECVVCDKPYPCQVLKTHGRRYRSRADLPAELR